MSVLNPSNRAGTATTNGTILASILFGGFLTRSGPTGNFTETLPATSTILQAMAGLPVGGSFVFTYINTVAHTSTFSAGDASTTLSGSTTIPAISTAVFLFTITSASTVSAVVLYRFVNN